MESFETLLVASLLHDLGKLWQRTGQRHSDRYAAYGPSDYGPNGAHAKWSADAIERWLPQWRAAADAILRHHQPADRLARLVALADRLSAAERDDAETDQPPAPPGGGALWAATRLGQRQLRSIFTRLQLAGAPAPAPAYWPLAPLALAPEVLFPNASPVEEASERQGYEALWQRLVEDLEAIPPTLDFDARLTTVLHLLQRYTWCVPSAYYRQNVADISLYDHLRTTAAIAAALDRSGLDDEALAALLAHRSPDWDTPRLALLAADVTGIQRFLYTLTAARAARSLRGRSFFLQLVTEAVGRWLLRRLDLPLVNLLYAGGGRCYLLTQLPSDDQLAALRRDLDRILLATTDGELYLALACQPVACADLAEPERFRAAWNALHAALQEAKARKFAALDPVELADRLFAPRGIGGPEPPCAICRREDPRARREDDEPICRRCDSLIDLGTALRRARWLFLREVQPLSPDDATSPSYRTTLQALGLELHLAETDDELRAFAQRGPGTLLRIDDTDFLAGPALDVAEASGSIGLGFALLANVVPLDPDGSVTEFATIAAAGAGASGLGILRMDVDDLGRLFAEGLGQHLSLSRLASLSSGLRLFFEGWLAELARHWNRTKRPVYLVYAGGDDVFAVGHWQSMASFARTVRGDFDRFTLGNPSLHLSAGIAVVPEHAPLYQAAEDAREALEAAKLRSEDGRVVKNAVTFLGRTLDWSCFDAVATRVEQLASFVARGELPRSFLHGLAAIGRLYEAARDEAQRRGTLRPGQLVYGRWLWLAAYFLARAAERLPDGSAAREWTDRLRDEIRHPDVIATLWLTARWTELATRKEESA